MTISYRSGRHGRRGTRSIASSAPASATPSPISTARGPRSFPRAIHARCLDGRARRSSAIAFRVAEADGEIVGYVKLGPPELAGRDDAARPSSFASSTSCNEWHGPGAAQALMDWALAEAKARGGQELYLTVFTDNHRARRFYETLRLRRGRALRLHGRRAGRRGHRHAGEPVSRRSRPFRLSLGDVPHGFLGRAAASRRARCRASTSATAAATIRELIAENRRRAIEAVLPGASSRPSTRSIRRRSSTSSSPGRRTSGPTPTPWSPTGPACCSASSPPTARRCCSPTPRRASSARRMPAGAARSAASPRRRSRRWSGLAQGASGSPPRSARASSRASYEVDEAFRERFVEQDRVERALLRRRPAGKPHFDLDGYVVQRLSDAGIGEVEALRLDTYADPDRFYSYRRATHRNEPSYGRQISMIGLPIKS